MKLKNFVGEVVTIRKVKVRMPVETLARTLEEAKERIEKNLEEKRSGVDFGNDTGWVTVSSIQSKSHNETLISLETTIEIKEAE